MGGSTALLLKACLFTAGLRMLSALAGLCLLAGHERGVLVKSVSLKRHLGAAALGLAAVGVFATQTFTAHVCGSILTMLEV